MSYFVRLNILIYIYLLFISVSLLVIINNFIYLFTEMIIRCLDKLFDLHL